MIDSRITDRCRKILIDTARARTTITYGQLAPQLGVANQSLGQYLDAIYAEEMRAGRPDLGVVVVYADTGFGRFNSRGGPVRSVRVDPNDPESVRAYREELAKVYAQWSRTT